MEKSDVDKLPGILSRVDILLRKDLRHDYLEYIEEQTYDSSTIDSSDFWESYYSDLFSGSYDNPFLDESKHSLVGEGKSIYFYDNVPLVKYREFSSLTSLDIYLTREGIDVKDCDINIMICNDVLHCCLNPVEYNENGVKELLVSNSYNGLRQLLSDISLSSEYYIEDSINDEWQDYNNWIY